MALLNVIRGEESEILSQPVSDGALLFATDTKKIYLDKELERIEIASVQDLTDYITSNQLQEGLNTKAPLSHNHPMSQITDLDATLSAAIGEEASARQKQDQLLEQAIDDRLGADDIIAGNNVQVSHDDESGHVTISATDTKVTYTLTKSGSTITLVGSDGNNSFVTDDNTTYTLSSFGINVTAEEINSLAGITDNVQSQIDEKLSTTGGILSGTLTSQTMVPSANSMYDLGTDSYHYRNIYADHIYGTIDGSIASADKLTTPRTISLDGDLSGSTVFDGSSDVTISAQIGSGVITLENLDSEIGTIAVQSTEPTDDSVKLWIQV